MPPTSLPIKHRLSMSETLPTIAPGKRAVIAGRTGCGKTTLAGWLVSRSRQQWIILNPKHTTGYDAMLDSKTLSSFNAKRLDSALDNHRVAIINFSPDQNNPEFMDDVVSYLHNRYDNVGLLVDELYTLHKNGRPGPGLTGWLTRGRERQQSFIGLTQRPKWVSVFCFSEADYICSMALTRKEDRKTVVENSGRDEFHKKLDDRLWRWYQVDRDNQKLWGAVPLPRKPENENG
jgi:hypothetical protein